MVVSAQSHLDPRGRVSGFLGIEVDFRGGPVTSGEVWETCREGLDCSYHSLDYTSPIYILQELISV